MPPQLLFGHTASIVLNDDGATAQWLRESDRYVLGVGIPRVIDELLQRPL